MITLVTGLAWVALVVWIMAILLLSGALCYLIGIQIARYYHKKKEESRRKL